MLTLSICLTLAKPILTALLSNALDDDAKSYNSTGLKASVFVLSAISGKARALSTLSLLPNLTGVDVDDNGLHVSYTARIRMFREASKG